MSAKKSRFPLFRPADLLLIPLLGLILLLSKGGDDGEATTLLVHSGGSENRTGISEDTVFTVEGSLGPLTVQIEDRAVRILEAPCGGHDCVRQGWVSSPGIPLVCLPSGVYVMIEPVREGDAGVDAVSY